MNRKTIRFTDDEIEIVNDFAKRNHVNFSEAIKLMAFDSSSKKNFKGKSLNKKGYYVRLNNEDEEFLSDMAEKNGISIPYQIRYIIRAYSGSNVFLPLEVKEFRNAVINISKTGRLVNQAIKERRILGSAVAFELKEQIDSLSSAFTKLYNNAMKRVK